MLYIVNNDEILSHHGVLGMKWGIRRYQSYSTAPRKSGKKGKFVGEDRSKEYQKRLNNADKMRAYASAQYAGYSLAKRKTEYNLSKTFDKHNGAKKATKYIKQLTVMNNKMDDLKKTYKKYDKIINDTIKEMGDEYVYRVSSWGPDRRNVNMFSSKEMKQSKKEMNKKYGSAGRANENMSYYYQTARSNTFKVKKANEKNTKSKRWTKKRTQRYNNPVRTNYIFV